MSNKGNMDRFYAHSKDGEPPENWQPLEEHLRNVAELAAEFAKPFGGEEWARIAGLWHDIGKQADEFQAYLLRENGLDDSDYDVSGRINHSSAGAAMAESELGKQKGRILAYAIAGHHAGLPDWSTRIAGRGALPARLEEGRENLDKIREDIEELKQNSNKINLPPFIKSHSLHFWLRFLYSSLVDADFLDTEKFMNREKHAARASFEDISKLKKKFDSHANKLVADSEPTELNQIRSEILNVCRKVAVEKTGIFSLTVPTGGGKTLSSMAFALEHALCHQKKRIIYVIPYTSIIEQTANVYAEIFGAENIVEHHCNIDSDKETQRIRLASENWDAPIIVTTSVQFFESLYAAKPGRCRKLHNLADSVVILDEAQLLPPELLHPCVQAINELSDNYRCSIILCTATQPALPGINEVREIIPKDMKLYECLRRTEYDFPDEPGTKVNWEELAEELSGHRQVLCIVNRKRDCYDLYRLMPEGTIHLSTNMCGKHRSEKIEEIKHRLKKNKDIRVISTQLVEAGVDIDFPLVYRAYSGLDSIAQAAGRCNREGKLDAPGKVVIFNPPNSAPPGLLRKGEDTCRELASLADFNPHSPDEYKRYFGLYYNRLNDIGKEWYENNLIRDVNPEIEIQFRSAGTEFKMIKSGQKNIFVRFGDGAEYIEELRKNGPERTLMRKLQRYTVGLYEQAFFDLLTDGRIEEIWPGIYAQSQLSIYSDETGLALYESRMPIEDLMI